MTKELRARSPAKLILSGEHAVVYGAPAIATAINRYAESVILSHFTPAIFLNFLNLKYAKSFTLHTLKNLKKQMQSQYHAFLEGRCNIRDVLKKPFELLQFTVTNLFEHWNIPLSQGVEIRSSSNIPMGYGMGSSAAIVMSTLYALIHFFKLEMEPQRLLKLGREAENLQHGRSSGLDLYLALNGGCVHFQEGVAEKRTVSRTSFTIIETGTPKTTTGQCVAAVAHHFKNNALIDDFKSVTQAFDKALQQNNFQEMQTCIRENHRLLVGIDVVPDKVQAFIRALEKEGAAAKICGAGATEGDTAGAVLVLAENDISEIATKFGLTTKIVKGDLYGTKIV